MLASFILLTLLINFHLDEACFITNCPPGGKRSHGDIYHMRECLRCGPGNKGHCVNSNVCCGSDFGCLINNQYSDPCRVENFIPIPCKVPGKLCSSGQGVCVSNGICCSSGGCFNDLTCENDTPTNDESIQRIIDSQSSHTIQI
ncbi:neurophysin 1-like [Panonychus citri]|uniref:neurophysin 1-like n=1 Tax=Panonychus citri TaxID=50023 RepID=UPI0023071C53|nr:neurophysin 1-like [Panonychus citri]